MTNGPYIGTTPDPFCKSNILYLPSFLYYLSSIVHHSPFKFKPLKKMTHNRPQLFKLFLFVRAKYSFCPWALKVEHSVFLTAFLSLFSFDYRCSRHFSLMVMMAWLSVKCAQKRLLLLLVFILVLFPFFLFSSSSLVLFSNRGSATRSVKGVTDYN